MATTDQGIVMTHPDLPGRTITALTEQQAAVFAKSGWIRAEKPSPVKKTPPAKKEG